MRYFWTTGKEKLISAEEGKVGQEETVPRNGTCKKFMKLVQFILVVEIAFFLGWSFYSFYLGQPSSEIEEDHSTLNSLGALHNDSGLHLESPNHIKLQDESSQLNPDYSIIHLGPPAFPESTTPSGIETSEVSKESEEKSIRKEIGEGIVTKTPENEDKTADNMEGGEEDSSDKEDHKSGKIMEEEQRKEEDLTAQEILQKIITEAEAEQAPSMSIMKENFEILKDLDFYQPMNEVQEKEDESGIPEFIKMLHELDRAEAGDKQVSSEIGPSGEVISKQFHFQITFGRETGIGENSQEFEASQANSEERPASPVFFHIFFNQSDSGKSTVDPFSTPILPEMDIAEVHPNLIEEPIEVEEPFKWWINLPEDQDTRESGSSSEEKSSAGGDSATSVSDNGVGSLEKNIFEAIFGEPDLQIAVVPESEEAKNVGSTEVFESEPENLDDVITGLVTSFFSNEADEKESVDTSGTKIPKIGVVRLADGVHLQTEMPPRELTAESAEKVGEEYEKLIKALFEFPDDHKTTGSTDDDPSSKENKISEEETRKGTEDDGWKKEEELFHSQPTWKENDSEPGEFDYSLNLRNYEYDEGSNVDSTEYNYED